jgi:hypothetical protein
MIHLESTRGSTLIDAGLTSFKVAWDSCGLLVEDDLLLLKL